MFVNEQIRGMRMKSPCVIDEIVKVLRHVVNVTVHLLSIT